MKIYFNPLSPSSVAAAMKDLESFKQKLMRLEEELPKALCEFGAVSAKAKYDEAPYDILTSGGWSNPDIEVTVEPKDDGWAVVADGEEVCFVEFGAGVYFNGGESYLGTRPPEVVGIGEYGQGHGKQMAWAFGHEKPVDWTHGTPASNAMYYTAEEMRNRIVEEAKRILSDD